jgi:hypothetical protein
VRPGMRSGVTVSAMQRGVALMPPVQCCGGNDGRQQGRRRIHCRAIRTSRHTSKQAYAFDSASKEYALRHKRGSTGRENDSCRDFVPEPGFAPSATKLYETFASMSVS